MDKEKIRLTDPAVTPTTDVIKAALGNNSYSTYQKFLSGLADLEIENEWKYYPQPMCGKCWLAQGKYRWTTPRGAKKEKTIYWLSVWDGYFCIAVWFKEDNRAEALRSDVSEDTKKLIRAGKMFGPKMRTFPVEFEVRDTKQVADIFTMLRLKQKLEA